MIKINYKYNAGDNISGHSIIGWAGSIFEKGFLIKKGIQLKKVRLFKSANCIINFPVRLQKTKTKQNVVLEGLRGKQIYGEAEDYSKFKKVQKTGGHTHLQTTLTGRAYCLINIPIASRR